MARTIVLRAIKSKLPEELYDWLYRQYFLVRRKLQWRWFRKVSFDQKLAGPAVRRTAVLLTSMVSSMEALSRLNGQFEDAVSGSVYRKLPSNHDSHSCYALVTTKRDFNKLVTHLASVGFDVAVGQKKLGKFSRNYFQEVNSSRQPARISQRHIASNGAVLFSDDVCIHLFPLIEDTKDYYQSIAVNGYFNEVNREQFLSESFRVSLENAGEYDFDVDAVFTWVDGDDPIWSEKMAAHRRAANQLPPTAEVKSRFKSRDELKYAVRALLTYAPWIRNVYLVSDNQIPDWLSIEYPVKVISHEEIFPNLSDLPVFNSHAIEANLHRIDGLSENYLYFNDDVFLRSSAAKADFFGPFGSYSKFFYSEATYIPFETDDDLIPVDLAAANNSKLIHELFGFQPRRKFQHTPIALKRSTISALEARCKKIFESTSRSKFRSLSDYSIASSLAHHFGYVNGWASPGCIRYDYINLNEDAAFRRLERLVENDKRVACFCVNDVDTQRDNFDLEGVMSNIYPFPSALESGTRPEISED